MEIRQLKAFLAIAETKTFTAGARRVNVTQAAISMQIRQLEDEVGIPLFIRTPRRVILTEAGERLLDRARRILREHDTATRGNRRNCRCGIRSSANRFGIGDVCDITASDNSRKIEKQISECRNHRQFRHESNSGRKDNARRY